MKIGKILLLSAFAFACNKSDKEIITRETSSQQSNSKTKTQLILNVIDLNSTKKSGYNVLMFKRRVKENQPLPIIQQEILSDSEGIATFNFDGFVSELPDSFYFEAFFIITNSPDNFI